MVAGDYPCRRNRIADFLGALGGGFVPEPGNSVLFTGAARTPGEPPPPPFVPSPR